MHIREFKIQGFKSFASAHFHFNSDLNVLTGANNSGKTTVLEAIALWTECFRKRLWVIGKTDNKRKLKPGQYRLDTEAYLDIDSVRSPNFGDIFHDLETDKDNPIALEATLVNGDDELTVGFTIRYARGSNYIVDLKDAEQFPFAKFNDFFERLSDPFNVVYASPVAALLPHEDFETLPKIHRQVNTRQSMQVLRNRLYQLKKDAVRFAAFTSSVVHVLFGGQQSMEFSFLGDETKDVELPVRVSFGAKDIAKDISLLGSGAVQIIEIMLAVHSEPRDLNIILLDEPDSHIHRDIQRRLVQKLVEHTAGTQVFLTTHNESLVRSTSPGHLFHLEPRQRKTYWPVYRDGGAVGQKIGLQPSVHLKVLKMLGSETSIDFLNALEAERLVLVEGEDDARSIQAIVDRAVSNAPPFRAMYWSFDGVDRILQQIVAYKDVFSHFKNDKSLWEKAVLVIDRDDLIDSQRDAMRDGLAQKLGIPVYVSTSYTMEATVLSDVGKLKALIAQLAFVETGAVADITKIDALVNDRVAVLRAELAKKIASERFKNDLYHRLQNRRDKLDDLKIKNVVSTNDGSLQPSFDAWANAALAQGKLHLLANKEDVATLIEHVYRGLELPFRAADLFERLVRAASPSTWFDEWRELRAAVLP